MVKSTISRKWQFIVSLIAYANVLYPAHSNPIRGNNLMGNKVEIPKTSSSKSQEVKDKNLNSLDFSIRQLNTLVLQCHPVKSAPVPCVARLKKIVLSVDTALDTLDGYQLSDIEQRNLIKCLGRISTSALSAYKRTSSRFVRRVIDAHRTEGIAKPDDIECGSESLSAKKDPEIPLYAGFPRATDCFDKLADISVEDLKYGQQQVRRMVQDRPSMKKYLAESDPIWNWCARQFAGEFTGVRYRWDPNQTDGEVLAWHQMPFAGRQGTITVGQKRNMGHDAEDLISSAIFELFNIRGDRLIAPDIGKKSSKDLTTEITYREFNAEWKLLRFYRNFWIPHAVAVKLDIDPSGKSWDVGIPPSYEEWIKGFGKDSHYPPKHYGWYFLKNRR